jgi:hypothetical protein
MTQLPRLSDAALVFTFAMLVISQTITAITAITAIAVMALP